MPEEPPEVSELVVIANRIIARGGHLGPSYPLPDELLEGDAASTGGGKDQEPDPCSYVESKLEKQTDAKANAAAATIKGQNWQTQEYGAFIYRGATGAIRIGVMTGGTAGQWTPSAENMSGITSYAQILGFIHNHPPNTEQGENGGQPSARRDQNGTLIGGDWFTFQYIQQQIAAAGGDPTQLRQYVIGPDGVLRYFDSSHFANGGPGVEIDPTEPGCP